MSKSQTIRGVMTTDTALTAPQITERSSLTAAIVSSFLTQAVERGEVVREGARGDYTYRLNADYTPSRKSPKRQAKRAKSEKRAPTAKSYRALADKARSAKREAGEAPALHDLAILNHIAAGESLRDYVRNNIDGFADDTTLVALVENHERAESMVKAARAT